MRRLRGTLLLLWALALAGSLAAQQAGEVAIERNVMIPARDGVRVDIASSSFPRFDLNPNTREPLGRNRRIVVTTNTIRHDATHPSSITLSILPAPSRSATP